MYSIDWPRVFFRNARGPSEQMEECLTAPVGVEESSQRRRAIPNVSRTVWALGFTSLLTDISSEMVSSVLPVYLVLHLGMSPLMFGLIDGIYQAAAVIVRIVAGVSADRWQRHKETAVLGYGISAICRPLLLAVGNFWGGIAGVIALDRIGKGIRTAPRDALISQSSKPSELGTAFGVHRALDAAGAMLGPVLAFALLSLLPGKFDILFVASFGVAIVGVGIILLFVPGGYPRRSGGAVDEIAARTILRILREPRFRAQTLAGSVLGVATISDSFIFLILQKRHDLSLGAFPLLYVGVALTTALFAFPLGYFADRLGRTAIFICGHVALLVVYTLLAFSVGAGIAPLIVILLILGVYYSATDGVLTAMAASILPRECVGSGLAVLATATNLARITASVVFGLLWNVVGTGFATVAFLVLLVASIAIATWLLRSSSNVGEGVSS